MRLSPVFVTVVAIAAPLGGSLSATAQTPKNTKQTAQVFTPATNQEQKTVTVLPTNLAPVASPEVIVPTSMMLKTAQTTAINPNSTPQVNNVPDIPPPNTQQKTPNQSPDTTTARENVNSLGKEPLLPVIPRNTQTLGTQQTIPKRSPQITIARHNVNPHGKEPLLPLIPRNTQTLGTQQRTAKRSPNITIARHNVNSHGKEPLLPLIPKNTQTQSNQQRTAKRSPKTTIAQENFNTPGAEPVLPLIPGNNQPQNNQQTAPNQSPETTSPQENFDPSGAQPVIPNTQDNTQTPETQQRTPNAPPDTTNPQENITPPGAEPVLPTTPENNQQNQAPEATEARVLVSEVLVSAEAGQVPPELENQVYRVIRTQPGRTTTRSQLQEDINAIFGTGFFSNVQAVPEDTPLGVRVSFVVQPNPVLSKVQVEANANTGVPSVLPANTVDEIFRDQYGSILNLRSLQEGIKQLNKRYQDRGYVLAQVVGAPQVSENGVVTLQVAEGVVENINVQFRNKEGQITDDKGRPIRGQTQNYIITRELQLKPGQVFNRNMVQKDLQRVFGLGLFEDVNVSLNPGTDPSKVDVVVNVVERSSGSIAAGAGISSASGLFGTISYQQQNLGGRNQKLGTELQVGQRELLFDLRFTDPWIAGDPYRTSYTANIFRRRSISLIFDGEDDDIRTFNPGDPEDDGDRPRVLRLGGGVTFTRPLSKNPYEPSEWTASAGLQYQRVSSLDSDGDVRKVGRVDRDPNKEIELTQSGDGRDDLLFVQLGAQRDRRNNALQPTSGSYLRLGVDQSVPIGLGSILMTRLRGSYSRYFPVQFTNFTKGPQTLAFNLQGGTVLGDLPPYEAFTVGGSNSVRGYEEGILGSGRSYVQASLEYRFPVFSVVSGALFLDAATDLGSSTKAAELLNKSGSGYGYGLGVRVQSPLGPIRVDYGINDDGESRINFGIGERF